MTKQKTNEEIVEHELGELINYVLFVVDVREINPKELTTTLLAKLNKLDKRKLKKIIDEVIMFYQFGVDSINEEAFEKEIANKKGIKSKTVEGKFKNDLDGNKKLAVGYAIARLSTLIREEGEVVAEGRVWIDRVDKNDTAPYDEKVYIEDKSSGWDYSIGEPQMDNFEDIPDKVAKYEGKKIQIIIKEVKE